MFISERRHYRQFSEKVHGGVAGTTAGGGNAPCVYPFEGRHYREFSAERDFADTGMENDDKLRQPRISGANGKDACVLPDWFPGPFSGARNGVVWRKKS